ncbi:MAG TPA: tetratricopeptide repeat protein [bacterium]|nr:tetratricopeptide repeat protein [bacterium]
MTMTTRRVIVLTALVTLGLASTLRAQPQTEIVQPVDVYLRSARIALGTNPPEYDRAQRNLEMARQHYPENFEVHLLLGTVWASRDEIDSMMAEYALARKFAGEKDWAKKGKDIGKLIDSKWLDRFNRGVNLLSQSDSLADIAQQQTDSAKADSMRIVVEKVRKMSIEALRHCTLLRPDDFRAYATRGIVLQRMGDNTAGLADFVRAESLFHRNEFLDSTTNWYDTTVFFTGQGEKTEAWKEFEAKYKKLNEEKRNRYNNLLRSLGAAYYDAQKWQECLAINRRYLGLYPKDINSIVTLADIFSRLGNDTEAYKWQEITVNEDPNNKDTWYNLGIFYYNNAVRLQDSIAAATKVIERDGRNSPAKATRLAFLESSLENFARAIPRFKKVVELDEKDHETWRLLGICYYSVASLAVDAQLEEDAARQSATLNKVWEIITAQPGAFDQNAVWDSTEEALRKGTELFPDDQALCKMMKVTLAQLNRVDELREWAPKCP